METLHETAVQTDYRTESGLILKTGKTDFFPGQLIKKENPEVQVASRNEELRNLVKK